MKLGRRISVPGWIFIGWLVVMTLLPFFIILGMSWMKKGDWGTIQLALTFSNYARCFQWLYARVLWKTLGLAATATSFCLVVGLPVAYFIARSKGWVKQMGLVILFIPFWTNFILRIYGILSLAGNHGLINQALMGLGIIHEPLSILYTRTGVLLGLVYNYLPFLVVPIYSALEKLDPAYREASQDLGADRFTTFWRVVVPNIKEGILVGSFFVFIPMMGEYVIPDLLGGAKDAYLGKVMVSQFFVMQDWPFGSAIAGLLSLLMAVALFFQTRWERPTLDGGAER